MQKGPQQAGPKERTIIHLDMDCFFASVAASKDAAFKGSVFCPTKSLIFDVWVWLMHLGNLASMQKLHLPDHCIQLWLNKSKCNALRVTMQ